MKQKGQADSGRASKAPSSADMRQRLERDLARTHAKSDAQRARLAELELDCERLARSLAASRSELWQLGRAARSDQDLAFLVEARLSGQRDAEAHLDEALRGLKRRSDDAARRIPQSREEVLRLHAESEAMDRKLKELSRKVGGVPQTIMGTPALPEEAQHDVNPADVRVRGVVRVEASPVAPAARAPAAKQVIPAPKPASKKPAKAPVSKKPAKAPAPKKPAKAPVSKKPAKAASKKVKGKAAAGRKPARSAKVRRAGRKASSRTAARSGRQAGRRR